jgi:hypothetical protein
VVDIHIADHDMFSEWALCKLLPKHFECTAAWPVVDVVDEEISPIPSLVRTPDLQDLIVR